MPNRWGNNGNNDTLFWGAPKSLQMVTAAMKLKDACSLEEKLWPTCCCCCCIASVVSNSVRPHRRQPTRLPCPWDSPGKNTGVGCHFLLHDQPRQHIKKQRYYFANKGPSSQGYGFSSSHVWMGELDYKKSWALKNWCFWTVVLEKSLESPLDCKEIQVVHPKGNRSWIFIGRTDVEAETPIL